MPTNAPNPTVANDPYADAIDRDGLSEYERDQQLNRIREVFDANNQRMIETHRGEVDQACEMRQQRQRIDQDRERFDQDPTYRARVMTARKGRLALMLTAGICLLIFFADLFIASPDLAEDLAHPVMSLIPESWLGTQAGDSTASNATPNWLRLTLGVMLSLIALALTVAVKILGDEKPVIRARRNVAPGDQRAWRATTRQLWARRATKIGYLAIMFSAFAWLYSYAEKRAEIMESLAADSQDHLVWEELGLGILNTGEVVTNEATSEKIPSSTSLEKGGSLALGAAATYSMLFILHALLLILPMPQTTIDMPLAKFSPHEAAKHSAALRGTEAQLLRGIVARIQTTPAGSPIRETLIILSEPVARAVNELYEREIMPIPRDASFMSASINPSTDYAGEENHSGPDFADSRSQQDSLRSYAPENDDDPASIIFGRPHHAA